MPGLAAAVVKGGQLVWAGSTGSAQLELAVPLTTDSVFEIASITKLFTAEVIMLLVQAGRLALTDAIGDYLGSLPEAWQGIRIIDILRHRSGIRNYTTLPAYWKHTREDLPYSHILEMVADLPLESAPGSRYAYDNTGFFLLGLLLESLSGKTYGELLQELIFAPLNMQATRVQNYVSVIPGRVAGYTKIEGEICNKPYYSATGTFSGGCLLSSVTDLARYSASLHTHALLPESLRAQMWTPEASPAGNELAAGFCLGLGWFHLDDPPFWGHNGSIKGFASALVHMPDIRTTAIVLTNADWLERPDRLACELIAKLAEET
ncbi:MAG: serine hydrolase domain-containing protein [Candidatus Sericytochromatia bacterium]